MLDCIFCKIASGEIPVTPILETGELIAFHDQNPQAPVHILVIPKQHIANIAVAEEAHGPLLGKLMRAASEVAEKTGIADSGFRVVANVGQDGGQSVDHMHLHVLGGRPLAWPPG